MHMCIFAFLFGNNFLAYIHVVDKISSQKSSKQNTFEHVFHDLAIYIFLFKGPVHY